MEGQAFVQYSGIGGMNLSASMPPDISGSSGYTIVTPDGNETVTMLWTVTWKLPGGIINRGATNPDAAWGYILGRGHELHKIFGPFTDREFCDYLLTDSELKDYGFEFNEQCELTAGFEHQAELEERINNLTGNYLYRVIDGQIHLEPGYDLAAFLGEYAGCVH